MNQNHISVLEHMRKRNLQAQHMLSCHDFVAIIDVYGNVHMDECTRLKIPELAFWTGLTGITLSSSRGWTGFAIGVKTDGTVIAAGENRCGQCNVNQWKDIVSVQAGKNHTVGLKRNGTVIATGNNQYGQCNVSEWTDIIQIAADDNCTIGLKSDGTVIAAGDLDTENFCISSWTNIAQIAVNDRRVVAVKQDGTIITDPYFFQHVDWNNIVYAFPTFLKIFALTSTGEVLVADFSKTTHLSALNHLVAIEVKDHYIIGINEEGYVVQYDLNDNTLQPFHSDLDDTTHSSLRLFQSINTLSSECIEAREHQHEQIKRARKITRRISDMIAISDHHCVAVSTNGTVYASGDDCANKELDVAAWTRICAVAAGDGFTVGLKDDGHIVIAGNLRDKDEAIREWKDIIAISAGYHHLIGLQKDGNIKSIGTNEYGQCNVTSWENIEQIWATDCSTAARSRDGRVYTTNERLKDIVSGWSNIVDILGIGTRLYVRNIDDQILSTDWLSPLPVFKWTSVCSVSGYINDVILNLDGTVTSTDKQCKKGLHDWNRMVAIKAAHNQVLGVCNDGTVKALDCSEGRIINSVLFDRLFDSIESIDQECTQKFDDGEEISKQRVLQLQIQKSREREIRQQKQEAERKVQEEMQRLIEMSQENQRKKAASLQRRKNIRNVGSVMAVVFSWFIFFSSSSNFDLFTFVVFTVSAWLLAFYLLDRLLGLPTFDTPSKTHSDGFLEKLGDSLLDSYYESLESNKQKNYETTIMRGSHSGDRVFVYDEDKYSRWVEDDDGNRKRLSLQDDAWWDEDGNLYEER